MGEQWISVSRGMRSEYVELSEDFSLPDYVPEVRRILCVVRDATADNGFRDGGVYLQEGNAAYTVFYLGEDGQIASVPLNTPYTIKLPLPEECGAQDGFLATWDMENVSCRATSPRRLSLSARLHVQAIASGREDAACRVETGEDAPESAAGSVVLQKEAIPTVTLRSTRHTAAAEGTLRENAGTRIAGASGNICIQDVKPVPGGGLRVTGEATVLLLACGDGENGAPYPVRSRCTIEETIPASRVMETGGATAFAHPASLEVDCGEDGAIAWHMEYDLHVMAMEIGESESDTDGYSTVCAEECAFREETALFPAATVCGRVTLSGEKKTDVRGDFVYGCGRGQIERVEYESGRLICVGSATISAVFAGEEWTTEECTLPLRYEINALSGDISGELMSLLHVTICDVSCRAEGDVMRVTAEAAIDGVICTTREKRLLSEITLREPLPERRPTVRIYVPEEKESVWEVQKKYRAVPEQISESGGRYVIVEG